jgi:hypothetical protein
VLASPARVEALVLASPGRVGTETETLFGFGDDQRAWDVGAKRAAQLGAEVARIPVGWSANPATFARTNRELMGLGIRPVINLWGCEQPPSIAEFKAQVRAWATAYPKAVIQIWNEPNHPFFGDFDRDYAAQLARAGAMAAREVHPHGAIVGPALAPETEDGRPSPRYLHYFRAVYRAIPNRLRVRPAVHIFPYGPRPLQTVRRFYRVADAAGRPWVTEIGISKYSYGERQPKLTAEAFEMLEKLGAEAVTVYRLLEPGTFKAGHCGPSLDQLATGSEGLPPSPWETQAAMAVLGNTALRQALEKVVK